MGCRLVCLIFFGFHVITKGVATSCSAGLGLAPTDSHPLLRQSPLPTPYPSLIPQPSASLRTPKESGIGRRDTPLGCARGGQGPLRNDLRPPNCVFSHLVWMSPSKPSRPPLPLKACQAQRPKLLEDQLPLPQALKYQGETPGEGVTLKRTVVSLSRPLFRMCILILRLS